MRRFGLALALLALLAASIVAPTATSAAPPEKLVGTWFEPWHNRTTQLLWREGPSSDHQLLGDVNGDGKDDAVVTRDGTWWIALSTGTTFCPYVRAVAGLAADDAFLGDVNGDGNDDAIAYAAGTWTVALSSGSSFGTPTQWLSAASAGSRLVADVDGDGRMDAVLVDTGDWSVALSSGSGFGAPTPWGTMGAGTALAADVTGDGRVDAVAVDGGDWSVGISTGTTFQAPTTWLTGFTGTPLLGDITRDNGPYDGKADAVVFNDGVWSLAWSDGGGFVDPHVLQPYRAGFGGNTPVDAPVGAKSTAQFVGNTYGDPTGSLVAYDDGDWLVTGANNYYYKQKNRWEAWNIRYIPESAPGRFAQYDTADPAVIRFQLRQLADAGINFLIFDQTNGLHVDDNSILGPNLAFVRELDKWNDDADNPKIRYSVAVGVVNYTHHIRDIEREAGEVWDLFTNDPDLGGDNYVTVDGKPLLILYTWREKRDEWLNSDIDKTNTDRFHMGYAEGPLYQGYYGWYNPLSGRIADDDVMFVTPRRADPDNIFARSLAYYEESWQQAIRANPRIVVAGCYNDYTENGWWAPTDTSQLPPDMAKYEAPEDLDPYAAYKLTKRYARIFAGGA